QLQSQPRPQALVQKNRPRPQPVVNNTDSQENTAVKKRGRKRLPRDENGKIIPPSK
ncbi:hypothetical protein BpHYR1_016833, partial [Brachionus plicatilis]